MRVALRAYTPAIACAGIVLLIGSLPDTIDVDSSLPLDKLAHFLMYAVFGWLLARGWVRASRVPHAAWLLALAVLAAAADELHQRTLPGRSAEVADFAADVAGIGIAFAFRARIGEARHV